MLADPLTITYNSVAYTLNRVNQDAYSSEYKFVDATQELVLLIRHSNETVRAGQKPFERHQVTLTRTEFNATTGDVVYQAYVTMRRPKSSDPDKLELLNKALVGFETDANIDKIVGWQS